MTRDQPILLGTAAPSAPRFKTVSAALRHHAVCRSDQVVFEEHLTKRTITFADLDVAASAVAAALRRQAPVGSSVALVATPGIDAAVAYCGIAYAGMSSVLLPTPEAARDVDLFAPVVRDLRDRVRADLALDATNYCLSGTAERRCWFGAADPLLMRDMAGSRTNPRDKPVSSGSGLAHWLFSSGTTGTAKAIRLSHKAVAFNCEYTARMWEFGASDRMVGGGSPYHSAGLMTGYLLPIFVGASAILLSPTQTAHAPRHLLTAISSFGASHLACPDSVGARLVRLPDEVSAGLDLSAWRSVIIGGEPLTREVLDGLTEWLPRCGAGDVAIGTAFGMSEAAGLITSSGMRRPQTGTFDILALSRGEAVAASGPSCRFIVSGGAPSHGVQVAVIDPGGLPLPIGRLGRVVLSSPSLFDGYEGGGVDRVSITPVDGAERADFFETGDIGFFMEGQAGPELAIAGRAKEAVPISGSLFHGVDLEQVASRLLPPGTISRIVAAPDPIADDRVLIIAESTEDLSAEDTGARIRMAFEEALPALSIRIVVIAPMTLPSIPTSSKKPRARVVQALIAGQLDVRATSTLDSSRITHP